MVIADFSFLTSPRVYFGAGKISGLPGIIGEMGDSVLIVTGASSFKASGHWDKLESGLKKAGIQYFEFQVEGEPTAELIDLAVNDFRQRHFHAVVAIGGGSVIDTGKAISAMLPYNESVEHFLEGVGTKRHDGTKAPFIAVPTTAGTGSEATKNAVLAKAGLDGYKKSLRHDNFFPDVALIDPELALTCSPEVTAASGMDALTQLLESYVSTSASAMTDALAESGLKAVGESLGLVCGSGANDIKARSGMAYAAYLSGVTLSNAGLGTVHGFASSIGGLYEVPHGVICGTLLAAVTGGAIEALRRKGGSDAETALNKYSKAGSVICGRKFLSIDDGCTALLDKLAGWTEEFGLPRLGEMGIKASGAIHIAEMTDNKNNPYRFTREELTSLLKGRI